MLVMPLSGCARGDLIKSQYSWIWPYLATATYIALMTALARASDISYLLFPELGALASVVFADPLSSWARSPKLLVLTPVFTAVPGVLLTRTLPYGPIAVILDLAICLLVIRALRSPVIPAISAGVLPLVLGITSWLYPLAILVGTGGLALIVMLRAHLMPLPARAQVSPLVATIPTLVAPNPWLGRVPWLLPLAVFLLGALAMVQLLGSNLVLYPPLLVIAWEMLAHADECPWQGRSLSVLAVTGGAAVAGVSLVLALGVSPLAAFLAVLVTALLLRLVRLRCAPAFGLALLPFIIPNPTLAYPLLTLAGTAWLLLVVKLDQILRIRFCNPQ